MSRGTATEHPDSQDDVLEKTVTTLEADKSNDENKENVPAETEKSEDEGKPASEGLKEIQSVSDGTMDRDKDATIQKPVGDEPRTIENAQKDGEAMTSHDGKTEDQSGAAVEETLAKKKKKKKKSTDETEEGGEKKKRRHKKKKPVEEEVKVVAKVDEEVVDAAPAGQAAADTPPSVTADNELTTGVADSTNVAAPPGGRDADVDENKDSKDVTDGTSLPEDVHKSETEEQQEKFDEPKAIVIEDAALSHREKERESFDQLISENAKHSSKITRLEKLIGQLEHKENELSIELEAEKAKSRDLVNRVSSLDLDLKVARSGGAGGNRPNSSTSSEYKQKAHQADSLEIQTEMLANKIKEGQETEEYLRYRLSEITAQKEQDEAKVKDYQLRLTRMTKDCEEKDRRVAAMEKESREIVEMISELEKYVDAERVEKIRAEHQLDDGGPVEGKNGTLRPGSDTNVVSGDKGGSKTCVIL